MVVAFVLAGVPVWRLTRPAAADLSAVPSVTTSSTDPLGAKPAPLEMEVVFAPAPADFQIKNLDQIVLAGHGPQSRFTARWTAAVPSEGVDLVIQSHWAAAVNDAPSGTSPAAARITVRFIDGRQVEKSFWAAANGALTEIFTVPGAPTATAP